MGARPRHFGCRMLKLGMLLAAVVAVGAARAMAEESPVLTRHHARIAGKDIRYSAEAGRIAICDVETGEPHGYMFYTAYRVAVKHAPRPVTFIWNGGPGADSSLLHFSAVGPRRIDEPAAGGPHGPQRGVH